MKPETVKAFDNLAHLRGIAEQAKADAERNMVIGRPQGSITANEYAVLNDVEEYTAARILKGLVKRGEWEAIAAVDATTSGACRVMRQIFYRKVSNAVDGI